MRGAITFLALLSAFATGAYGGECDQALGYVRDTTTIEANKYSSSSFKHFFCDREFSSFQGAKDAGVSAGFSIDGLPVSFGGHDRSSSFSEYRKSLCSSLETQAVLQEDVKTSVVKANSDVIAAWERCVTQAGFHFWAETNESDKRLVVLKAKYMSTGEPYATKAQGPIAIQPSGAMSCSGAKIEAATIINSATQVLNCKRNDSNAVTAVLNTVNGGDAIRLASISMAPPARPVWQESGYRVPLKVTAHIQKFGDQIGSEGAWVGTKGASLRLEGFQIDFRDPLVPDLGIEYMCHLQGKGDTAWMSQGKFCGTRGESRRLEGMAFRLTGANASRFALTYSCHVQGEGDRGAMAAPAFCGTRGKSLRTEAMLIEIVAK